VGDFRPLHVEAFLPGDIGHYVMIFMAGNYRQTRSDIGRVVAALDVKLTQCSGEEDLADTEDWLQSTMALWSWVSRVRLPSLTPCEVFTFQASPRSRLGLAPPRG
jgi:hypothetical protein